MSEELAIRKPTPLELAGVPKANIKPNAIFGYVDHPEARNIGGGSPQGIFDESGSSGQLRGSRPNIPYGAVWCQQCNRPCDFEEGGMHNLFGRPDSSGHHRGYLLIRAECHGETSDIALTFEQARENARKSIIAFPEKVAILFLPEKEPANDFDRRTKEIMDRFEERQGQKKV